MIIIIVIIAIIVSLPSNRNNKYPDMSPPTSERRHIKRTRNLMENEDVENKRDYYTVCACFRDYVIAKSADGLGDEWLAAQASPWPLHSRLGLSRAGSMCGLCYIMSPLIYYRDITESVQADLEEKALAIQQLSLRNRRGCPAFRATHSWLGGAGANLRVSVFFPISFPAI